MMNQPYAPLRSVSMPGRLATVCAAALLTACASTPLPPWPSAGTSAEAQRPSAPAPQPRTQPGVVVPAPLGSSSPIGRPSAPAAPGVTITPLGTPLPGLPTASSAAEPLPYSEAVAARFPDPATRYQTPGLADGRRALTTNTELSDWLQRLTHIPANGGTRLEMRELGKSQQGTPILAMVATRAKTSTPDSLEASGHPTVLLLGQQHGDEPASAEALLVVARELAPGGLLEPLLDRINVIVVPRANPDGAETGERSTANGLDLNSDHLLLETPEAQALAMLVRDYRPLAVLDLHEYVVTGPYLQKFNAIQSYDALMQYGNTANTPEFVTRAAREWFHAPMADALRAQKLTTDWYYTTSNNPQDLRVSMGGLEPHSAHNINGLKNTVSVRVESRGEGIGRAHLQRRVHTHITAVSSALRSAADRASSLKQVRSFVTRDVSALACHGRAALVTGPTSGERDLTMIDPVTGADRTVHVQWQSTLAPRTLKARQRPCGYWLAPGAQTAAERLQMLGVQVMRVAESGSVVAETYAETGRQAAPAGDAQGAAADIALVEVTPTRTAIDIPAGSFYIPMNQGLANVAMAALEPDTAHSYFAHHLLPSLADTARIVATPSLVFEEQD